MPAGYGTSRGVPLASAVIVRHTPNDFSPRFNAKSSGAVPMSAVGRGLQYIGRYGDYEDRGHIEREATRSDRALAGEWGRGDYLEYISREGEWAGKGAGRQIDASLWGQHGPVSYEEAAREMKRAGGAFVPSIVSIDRRYAERLGLEGKEQVQDLMRATWSRNVEKWGLIRDPSDIRWVAAYHTDAPHSVHVHVFTWSARGEIAPGATVGREGTRAGREVINDRAYSGIRDERNARATLLRDMARAEVARQLGRGPEPERARSLDRRAQELGMRERVSPRPDISEEGKRSVGRLEDKLRGQLDEGRGRISRNWQALGTASDIVRELERTSPSFGRLADGWRECSEVKADLKGMTGPAWEKERNRLIEADRRDWLERNSRAVVAAVRPDAGRGRDRGSYRSAAGRSTGGYGRASDRERADAAERARERRRRAAERDRQAAERMSSRDWDAASHLADRLGIGRDEAVRMGREAGTVARSGARSWDEASPAARGAAYGWAREFVKAPAVQADIASRAQARAAARGTDPASERAFLERSAVADIARFAIQDAGRAAEEAGRSADRGPAAPHGSGGGGFSQGLSQLAGLLSAIGRATAAQGGSRGHRPKRDRAAERQRFGGERER